jgi:hypothetical protein
MGTLNHKAMRPGFVWADHFRIAANPAPSRARVMLNSRSFLAATATASSNSPQATQARRARQDRHLQFGVTPALRRARRETFGPPSLRGISSTCELAYRGRLKEPREKSGRVNSF